MNRPLISIAVPPAWRSKIAEWGAAAPATVELRTPGYEDAGLVLNVQEIAERRACTLEALYINGWIECEVALQLAGKLGIPSQHLGQLINLLNIKIRNCSLGCF